MSGNIKAVLPLFFCVILTAGLGMACFSLNTAEHNREAGSPEVGKATGAASPMKTAQVNPLVGTWSFENPGYGEAVLTFREDYQVSMQLDASSAMQGRYSVDYSHTPVWLDITWSDMETVQTIIRFLGEHKLQLQNNDLDLKRPVEFSDDSVILLRDEL